MAATPTNVEKARVNLILSHPFFAIILLKRPLVSTGTIPTMATDGVQIFHNPNFTESITSQECTGVYGHEILHIVGLHHLRMGGRELKRWNYACDYAINPILIENKFKLPKGALLDDKYKDMTAEKIYDLLDMKEEEKKQGVVLIGDVNNPKKPDGSVMSSAEVKAHIAQVKMDIAQAVQTAKMIGKLPAGIEMFVEHVHRMGKDWKQLLAAHLTEHTKNDYTFKRPNPRYISRGFYMPTMDTVDKGRFILACDTSGSHYTEQNFRRVANEMMSLLALTADQLTVIFCDSAVAHVQEIDPLNPEPLKFRGGGGTSFKPVTKWIEENAVEPEVLIYFTDLLVDEFPEEPPYHTVWVSDNLSLSAPYGDTIYLDDDAGNE